ALRILVPKRLVQMHAPEHQDVRPAIRIEIPDVTKQRIRRRWLRGKLFRGIELVARGKIRAFVPKRSGDDVGVAVPIKIAAVDAVAEIFVRKHAFLETWLSCRGGS